MILLVFRDPVTKLESIEGLKSDFFENRELLGARGRRCGRFETEPSRVATYLRLFFGSHLRPSFEVGRIDRSIG